MNEHQIQSGNDNDEGDQAMYEVFKTLMKGNRENPPQMDDKSYNSLSSEAKKAMAFLK